MPEAPTRAAGGHAESTWFGTIDGGLDGTDGQASLRQDRGEWRASEAPPDSRFLSRQARRIAASGPSSFVRLFRVFVNARALLGIVLLLAVLMFWLLSLAPPPGLMLLCAAYAGAALAVALFPRWLASRSPTGSRAGSGWARSVSTCWPSVCCR